MCLRSIWLQWIKKYENTHAYRRPKTATICSFALPARAPCGVFKEAGMRMMKCYLANADNCHFITADEAATGEPGPLACASCGCVLYVQPENADQKPWFMHDQSTVPISTLMDCIHSEPEIKAEAKLKKLRNSIGEQIVPLTVLSWYCVWCGQHYGSARG